MSIPISIDEFGIRFIGLGFEECNVFEVLGF